MKTLKNTYPTKTFTINARSATDKREPWCVVITSAWRLNLLKRSIESWPKYLGDNSRAKDAKKYSLGLASWLLFSLFHMHIRALTYGYQMSYVITENSIEMHYTV
jgi:hypothetical protein